MAIQIRLGNDLKIKWNFYKNTQKESLPLNGEIPVAVYLRNTTTSWKLEPVQIFPGYYEFSISGKDQIEKYGTGLFSLTCVANEGQIPESTIDLLNRLQFVKDSEIIIDEGILDENGYLKFESIAPTWYIGEQE